MKHLIIGIVIGVLLIPAIAFAYIRFGYAPVATAGSPFPLEHTATHMALQARIDREAPKTSPIPASDANLSADRQRDPADRHAGVPRVAD
jgi:hypothetical protein